VSKVDNNTANEFIAFLAEAHPEMRLMYVVEMASRKIALYESGERDYCDDDSVWLIDKMYGG
jgi:hypothetical protein